MRAHLPLVLFLLAAAAASACRPVQVQSSGRSYVGDSCDSFAQFLGIPFAEPPVGPLRFQPPAALARAEQLRRMSPVCMQHSPGESWARDMSEDCLYLNVYVPASPSPVAAPLPVLFFIYGGGFTQGGSSHPMYNASRLCANTGAIVVTSNYRLGAFGFFTDEDANLPGNTGLLDQRAALQWVSANIAAFGGDSGRVVVFGQSAGGISTAYHLTSPASAPLFYAAIIQSNPFHAFFRTPQENKAFTSSFLKRLGCPSPASAACLTAPSAAHVLAAQQADHALPWPLSLSEMVLSWQPVIDGTIVTNQTLDLLTSGRFRNDIPVVIGTVRDELVSFVWGAVRVRVPAAVFHELLHLLFGRDLAQRLIEMYPSAAHDARAAAADLLRDALFRCPTLQAAAGMTDAGATAWL
jgi:para-nitrobenzyl esterase